MAHAVFKTTELLEQILQHAIAEHTNDSFLTTGQHPVDLFPDFPGDRSRPVTKRRPITTGAVYLRVCKSWSDAGLRPLYHTVVLSRHSKPTYPGVARRGGQVASLVKSLRHHREPNLGRYIRVLVLYNNIDFGETFEELFKYTKNLHTLSIALNFEDVEYGETFDSLIKILPSITPCALILRDVPFVAPSDLRPEGGPPISDFSFSSDVGSLVYQISACLKNEWKDSLEVLRVAMPSVVGPRHSPIYEGLPFLTRLRELHLRKSALIPVHAPYNPEAPVTAEYLKTLPSLQQVTLQCDPFSLPLEFCEDTLNFRIIFKPVPKKDKEEDCIVNDARYKQISKEIVDKLYLDYPDLPPIFRRILGG
ncbi:hypothetical protein R3P38DRAFT_3200323 [Favolaschia claudopus]|uniref:Uncharacterized protein n=1 Tax=Favolaschia claudopus TaxID=2862362 RepID=A0AAW0B0A9_9AGAR